MSDLRTPFIKNDIYQADTISHLPPVELSTYSDKLLAIRLKMVARYSPQAKILDVCCATGQHLTSFAEEMSLGIGVDFCESYLKRASLYKDTMKRTNVSFLCCDAARLAFHDATFDLAFSFSSLYIIPNVRQVVREVARVLKPGGKCVLDFGNLHSLNTIVNRTYHREKGWARSFAVPVAVMQRFLEESGLVIQEHRSFQILPLWGANRPAWLKPFLWNGWTRLLSYTIHGKMLDEWISGLPLLNRFSFRHIFLCEKV